MKKLSLTTKVLIALAVIFIIFLIIKRIRAKRDVEAQVAISASSSKNSSSSKSSTSGKSASTPEIDNDTVLKKGSKGDRVQWVQYYYNKYVQPVKGGDKLSEDGIFGAKTEAAVKATIGKTTTNWTNFKYYVDSHFAGAGSTSRSTPTPFQQYGVMTNPF